MNYKRYIVIFFLLLNLISPAKEVAENNGSLKFYGFLNWTQLYNII